MGIELALASVALGVSVLEKHFTLSRSDGGVDSAFSLEPPELKELVLESERAWQALGEITYGATSAEQNSLVFRRSIYVAEDIVKGELLTRQNIRIVRPGDGLKPSMYKDVLGKKATSYLKRGSPLVLGSFA